MAPSQRSDSRWSIPAEVVMQFGVAGLLAAVVLGEQWGAWG